MRQPQKRAAETAPVPQNADQASALLAEIGEAQRQIEAAQAALDECVASAKVGAEAVVKPLQAAIALKTRGLEIWATANRDTLTHGGKTKTIALPAGALFWRLAPPAVRIAKLEDAIEALRSKGLLRFLRMKTEVNKEALLAEPETAGAIPGITIASAGEAFVAEPTKAPLSPHLGG